ncbi:hypothetical protein [Massilia sp. TS11]|uniref:hypothetical protein n=1 Tax=Massilia sp. TS11 TaxID=2908003 RepID=UPI001EDC05E6|nr:hypothetical protein [Massilia sp. TS11]MCG2584604.1 hypothetical protein [Massilia sp. TS11]
MTITSVTSTAALNSYQSSSTSPTRSQGVEGHHHHEGPPDGGAFIDAIASALQSIGGTSASSADSGGTASSTDPAQALGSFLHSLGQAMRAAGGAAAPAGPPPEQGGAQGARGHHGGGMAADLQSLISQLSTSDSSSNDSTKALQDSFNQLLGALGIQTNSDSGSSLKTFLQALASNLQGASGSGNIVNTSA